MTPRPFSARALARAAVAFAVLGAVALGVHSAEDELDTELMQTIEDTNKSMASNIALKEAKGAKSDAQELTQMFAKVEGHYNRKGDAPDAVDLARKSRELSSQILGQIDASDYGAATNTATNLARTCKTCHNFYKKS
ncbi:MAG: hypothetical protein V4738_06310 [Pseudomonadota bacterium]